VGQPVHITHQAQYLAKARARLRPAAGAALGAQGAGLAPDHSVLLCECMCLHPGVNAVCSEPGGLPHVAARARRLAWAPAPSMVRTRPCTRACVLKPYADAQVVGRLADRAAGAGAAIAGLLVRQAGGPDLLLAPDDLPAFTRLQPGRVLQRQALGLRQPFVQACLPALSPHALDPHCHPAPVGARDAYTTAQGAAGAGAGAWGHAGFTCIG